MKKKKNIVAIVLLMMVLGICSLSSWYLLKPPAQVIQGEADATQVQVASKIFARVAGVHIKKGESVKKGQLLVTFDSPEIEARMTQATAAHNYAEALQQKTFNGTRKEEVASARSNWLKAMASAELSEKTWHRIDKLYDDGVVPAQKRDEAEAQLQSANRTAEAARSIYEMALNGARLEDRNAVNAQVSQAAGVVAEVGANLRETSLYAPFDGQVVDVLPDPGELVSPGFPVVSIVDLNDVWLTFNIREDLLVDFKMGDVLITRIPALGNISLKAKVNYISALGEFATWRATKTSGDFDLKTFEVRLTPVLPAKGLRPGMSAIIFQDGSKHESL